MRASDCEILLVPGLGGAGPEHWQSRWRTRLSTARTVEQKDWSRVDHAQWTERLVEEAARASRPVVLIAHGCGVIVCVHAARRLGGPVRGAFLVAPLSDAAILSNMAVDRAFAPLPRDPLPFPSVLVASADNPDCPLREAEDFAFAWGSAFAPAGAAGRIDAESGHGPWPEGSLRFAMFLKTLS